MVNETFTAFVNANEPEDVKLAFGDQGIVMPLPGFDFLLYTRQGRVAIERKSMPGDLLASVSDGRLAREITNMKLRSEFQVLLLGPGQLVYDKDLYVTEQGFTRGWTKWGLENLLRTIQYTEGLYLEPPLGYVYDLPEMVRTVQEIQQYFDCTHHTSTRGRDKLNSDWLVPTAFERVSHFYQGLPSISVVRAQTLAKAFPRPMQLYEADGEALRMVKGIGPKLSKRIYNFLRTGKGFDNPGAEPVSDVPCADVGAL